MIYFLIFLILVFNVVAINNMLEVLERRREHKAMAKMLKVEQEYLDSIELDM